MKVKRLLLPIKGSPGDEDMVRFACELTRSGHGSIYALYVIEVPRDQALDAELPEQTQQAEEILRWVEETAKEYKGVVSASLLQARDSGPAIVEEAVERDVDLLLMGTVYKRKYGSFSLGATLPYVLQHAPCQVLALRRPMSDGTPLIAGNNSGESKSGEDQ